MQLITHVFKSCDWTKIKHMHILPVVTFTFLEFKVAYIICLHTCKSYLIIALPAFAHRHYSIILHIERVLLPGHT
jgi:hypothetical protein